MENQIIKKCLKVVLIYIFTIGITYSFANEQSKISETKVKEQISKLAGMYQLLQGKYIEHNKNKNSNAWKSFIREFRADIEKLRENNTFICNGNMGCFNFNMSYSSLDMMVLEMAKVLYRDNYPTKKYEHFKTEFIKYFTSIGGKKLQLIPTPQKNNPKGTWYVLSQKTGKGYITNHPPVLNKDEVMMAQEEMNLYRKLEKEIFKPEYSSLTDDAMLMTIAKKWKTDAKKLKKINLYGTVFNQLIQSGDIVDRTK